MSTALEWIKSSYSGSEGGACLEVAVPTAELVYIRDSKNPEGPYFTVTPATWTCFLRSHRNGDTSDPM